MDNKALIKKAYLHVQFDNLEEFQKFVPSQLDPNFSSFSRTDHLHSFLQCASAHGSEQCTKYLLSLTSTQDQNLSPTPQKHSKSSKKQSNKEEIMRLVDPNQKNFTGFTPLHWAAYSGRTETVKPLVEAGADINSRNEDGLTPLHVAASRGHLDFIKFLIKNYPIREEIDDSNPNINLEAVTSDGWTAVHYALIGNHQPVVNFLINEMNVDCSEPDVNMKTIQDIANEYSRSWFS